MYLNLEMDREYEWHFVGSSDIKTLIVLHLGSSRLHFLKGTDLLDPW